MAAPSLDFISEAQERVEWEEKVGVGMGMGANVCKLFVQELPY